jgi:germination protein M
VRKYLFMAAAGLLVLAVILTGCGAKEGGSPPETYTETVKLFYGDANNEKMVTEERSITFRRGEDKYTVVLKELLKGPENKDYRANIAPETKVYGTIQQDSNLIVDFSHDFSRFAGSMAETIGLGSVVNTLTQFEALKKVKILVEGEEYIGPSGMPIGFMEPFPTEYEAQEEKASATLYFSNQEATAVMGEERIIRYPPETTRSGFIKLVLEELIKGPRDKDLYPTIPPEVKVNNVAIEDLLCQVDFSEEMHSKHWGGAAGESMSINSIVNTLTEYPYIQRVKMTVEGEPLNIEHVILDEPVERNEEMIQDR